MSKLSNLLPFNLLRDKWSATLNPIIANPVVKGNLLQNIVLRAGDNTINHGLGNRLQGWIVVRSSAISDIYDKQDQNQQPELTLVLRSSVDVKVSIYVF